MRKKLFVSAGLSALVSFCGVAQMQEELSKKAKKELAKQGKQQFQIASSQQWLWLDWKFNPESIAYNLPFIFKIFPGLSVVPENNEPIIMASAPAAIALAISPENFIPPSEINLVL